MQVGGILETALYATDVKRLAEFYRRLFGFATLLENERLIALDVAGKSILLLFLQGGTTESFPVPGGDGMIRLTGVGQGVATLLSRSLPRTWKHGNATSNRRTSPLRAL